MMCRRDTTQKKHTIPQFEKPLTNKIHSFRDKIFPFEDKIKYYAPIAHYQPSTPITINSTQHFHFEMLHPRHQRAVKFLSTTIRRRTATATGTTGRSNQLGSWKASRATTTTAAYTTTHNQKQHCLSIRKDSTEHRPYYPSKPPAPPRQLRNRQGRDGGGSSFVVSSSARTEYDRIRHMILATTTAAANDNNNNNGDKNNSNKKKSKNELYKYPAASLRHSYDFLLSAAARNVAFQRKEHPSVRLDLAKKLLDHVIQTAATPDVLIQFAIGSDLRQGVNYGFGRLISQYLEPFRGTAKALHLTGEYTKAATPLADQEHALCQASQVAHWMQHVFNSKDYPQLVPSVEYYEILCHLWSRRCRFLAQTNLHIDFSNAQQRPLSRTQITENKAICEREQQHTQKSFQELVETGMGGAQSQEDCVRHIRLCLDEMEGHGLSADDERVRIHELTCLANSGVLGASEQAVQVFECIEDTATESFIPTLVGTVLLAYANELPVVADSEAFFGKAVQFWKTIQDRHTECARDPIAFSVLMRMASQVGNARQAEEWLEEMERLGIQPSTIHYNIVLTALTNNTSRIPEIQRIEEFFRRMETMAQAGRDTAPDKFTCTTMIKAFLRSYEPEERARAVLTLMERSTGTRLQVESPVYTEYMNGLKERFLRAQELHVKETIAIQMEEILRRMQQRTQVDHTLAGPNRYHLNSCFEIWSRSYSKLAPDRVKKIFADFCDQNTIVQPDGHTFRLILKALAICSNHETIDYAHWLLNRMKEEGLTEHIGVFNQYLHMLVKYRDSDSMEKAEKFVLQMEDDYLSGTSLVCPNGASYSIVLKEYSKQVEKEKQAELWFARMLQLQEDRERAHIVVIPDNYAVSLSANLPSHNIFSFLIPFDYLFHRL